MPGRLVLMSLVVIFFLAAAGALDQDQLEGGEIPADILRLHILAPSDDPEDQKLKLSVRDAVLTVLAPELLEAVSKEEACRRVVGRLEQVAGAAREVLKGKGKEYPVALQLRRSYFPARNYGSNYFPAGEYQALQIIIGEGAGANWWCVLFPPLCLVDGTTAKAADGEVEGEFIEGEEGEAASPTPEIRFKIVEWFQQLRQK
ncbi:MAG: stage II sporulation protein R [Firmicutes bacterium]|nr:stage II sporulation protein R [Bacillota bacterium]